MLFWNNISYDITQFTCIHFLFYLYFAAVQGLCVSVTWKVYVYLFEIFKLKRNLNNTCFIYSILRQEIHFLKKTYRRNVSIYLEPSKVSRLKLPPVTALVCFAEWLAQKHVNQTENKKKWKGWLVLKTQRELTKLQLGIHEKAVLSTPSGSLKDKFQLFSSNV